MEDRDSQEALELLCLDEGAEVTHYEVMTKGIKNKHLPTLTNGKIHRGGYLDRY
jgi:hypothetical protein